jgi:hypothetical protein
MYGRYQRRSDKQKIAEAFHLGNVDGLSIERDRLYGCNQFAQFATTSQDIDIAK